MNTDRMNTEEMLDYLAEHMERRPDASDLPRWIDRGWLDAEKGTPFFSNYYSKEQADGLLRCILAYNMSEAAKIISPRVGWYVIARDIRALCKLGMIDYVGKYRIPRDAMAALEEQLKITGERERNDG